MSGVTSPLEYDARLFATAAHAAAGQTRKYTGDPYIVHPAAVVELVRSAGGSSIMLAAAWLHDVVEDTKVPHRVILRHFGPYVARYVEQLTDLEHPKGMKRADRRRLDREHTAAADPEAKTIKLADLIDNTRAIAEHDPDFAVIYMAEKALLLDVLTEGNRDLWLRARAVVDDFWATPGNKTKAKHVDNQDWQNRMIDFVSP